jgi:uncharacterized coiled-coil protein SlyX
MEKETEIEGLARMIADGFSSMENHFDERIGGLEVRMDNFETRMERVEKVVIETNRRIDNVIMPTQEDHARRIKDLELKIA